jgi:hypothetical protein
MNPSNFFFLSGSKSVRYGYLLTTEFETLFTAAACIVRNYPGHYQILTDEQKREGVCVRVRVCVRVCVFAHIYCNFVSSVS